MSSSRTLCLMASALALMAVGVITTGQASGADYTVHVVDPPITNHMVLQDGPLPPVCKQADTIKLWACRGEYEPVSFVVSATSEPLKNVVIEVDPVVGPGEQWPKDAIDIRVVKTGDLPKNFRESPILLVHDDSFLGSEPGSSPTDPKSTKAVPWPKLRDTAELQPVTIVKHKQFWVTVQVPEHAKPGIHKTTIKIVPGNGPTSELTLAVEVYPFDLLAPMLEYAMYYPTYLVPPGQEPKTFGERTAEQMRVEFQNMLAHGLTNPNIYQGPKARSDGSLDFSVPDKILDLRESVGMRPKVLYLLNSPLKFIDRPLTPEEREKTHRNVRQINEWAKRRGYQEVFFHAIDELWGEALSRERDSMEAVREAGGKVFVAVMHPTFFDRVGDVLDRPILCSTVAHLVNDALSEYREKFGEAEALRHMPEIAESASFKRMIAHPSFRKAIDGVHRLGNKIYTYMNPVGGTPLPQLQRRCEGLGLWRVGFDGTMNWAYANIDLGDDPDEVNQIMILAKVYRTIDGVVDTTHWEGYREAVDDVRYLTTLYSALQSVAGRFPQEPLIAQTHIWLAEIDVANGDLDAIRREMAQRIIALQDLGYKDLPADQILKGIDLKKVRIVTFPEPWRFKIDPDDQGVKQKLFAPSIDDSQWAQIRTDKNCGWEKQGFGGEVMHGYGWYRARLPLTGKDLDRKFKYLYFEAVDEQTWIYLNGQEVFEHTVQSTGFLIAELWLRPFSVPLMDLNLRGNDLLAVRVHNSNNMGGIWKPVHLILSDQELTNEQLRELLKVKKR